MVVEGDAVILVKFCKESATMKITYTSGESDEYVYQRYSPRKPSVYELKTFTGLFYNDALKTTYTLFLDQGSLATSNKNQPSIIFTPSVKDSFVSSARNFGEINFTRDKQNNITGFQIRSDRFKKLYFEKINH